MLPDPEIVAEMLTEAAATEILPRFRKLERHEVQRKDTGELVTVADVAAEQQISRRLLDLLPGSLVVGEEAVAEEPGKLEALAGAAPVWVIDPIDGTGNFAEGVACFAVMTALVRQGATVGAWIHDPTSLQTAAAMAGEGAWLDGQRLQVSAGGPVASLRGTLHSGMFSTPDMTNHIRSRRHLVQTVKSLRCAGHEYLRLARAETDFSLFTKMMPWDHAPGVLIHREAGGTGRTLDGAPYAPARWPSPALLLAPDEASWAALHETLFGGSEFAAPA
jgi:fructose-1,6-bisphosphatase/inositol monophosphatase family enzyme